MSYLRIYNHYETAPKIIYIYTSTLSHLVQHKCTLAVLALPAWRTTKKGIAPLATPGLESNTTGPAKHIYPQKTQPLTE